VDTTDGVVMQDAYNWAFINPLRKAFYNLYMTGISVFLALVVGSIEVLQVIAGRLSLQCYFGAYIQEFSFAGLGYVIIGILAGGCRPP
jgi:high-affinity nickel-transport protein